MDNGKNKLHQAFDEDVRVEGEREREREREREVHLKLTVSGRSTQTSK